MEERKQAETTSLNVNNSNSERNYAALKNYAKSVILTRLGGPCLEPLGRKPPFYIMGEYSVVRENLKNEKKLSYFLIPTSTENNLIYLLLHLTEGNKILFYCSRVVSVYFWASSE